MPQPGCTFLRAVAAHVQAEACSERRGCLQTQRAVFATPEVSTAPRMGKKTAAKTGMQPTHAALQVRYCSDRPHQNAGHGSAHPRHVPVSCRVPVGHIAACRRLVFPPPVHPARGAARQPLGESMVRGWPLTLGERGIALSGKHSSGGAAMSWDAGGA